MYPATHGSAKQRILECFGSANCLENGKVRVADLKEILERRMGIPDTGCIVDMFLQRAPQCLGPTEPISIECFLDWLYDDTAEPSEIAATEAMAQELHDRQMAELCMRAKTDDLSTGGGCTIPKTEERAIQVPQLVALLSHVTRRCRVERWISTFGAGVRCIDGVYKWMPPEDPVELTPESINLYDLVHYVIFPATRAKRCSYVEFVATGAQIPCLVYWQFLAVYSGEAFGRVWTADNGMFKCVRSTIRSAIGRQIAEDMLQSL